MMEIEWPLRAKSGFTSDVYKKLSDTVVLATSVGTSLRKALVKPTVREAM
jgi:hypothetical protein